MARLQTKSRRRHHRFSQIIRPSLRDGFTVSFELSPVTMLGCHRRPQDAGSVFTTLTPALERQDHTTSPYATSTIV
jgi:hypothetical protein